MRSKHTAVYRISTWLSHAELQVYVPQNIHKIYFLHKISRKLFWWILFVFLYVPILQNFFLWVIKYIRQKDPFLFIVKVFDYFRYVPQNIHGHFQSYFQIGYTQSPEAIFAFYCTQLSHQCHIYCKLMLTPNSSALQN